MKIPQRTSRSRGFWTDMGFNINPKVCPIWVIIIYTGQRYAYLISFKAVKCSNFKTCINSLRQNGAHILIRISTLGYQWFRNCVTCLAPSHYLNQCWLIIEPTEHMSIKFYLRFRWFHCGKHIGKSYLSANRQSMCEQMYILCRDLLCNDPQQNQNIP